jgi:hypothetical protein
VAPNQFSWSDVKARRDEIEAASKSGDEWATAWLLVDIEMAALRAARIDEYPHWFAPDSRRERRENNGRFYELRQKRATDLLERVGVLVGDGWNTAPNAYLKYAACRVWRNSNPPDARKLLKTALDAGFEGAAGALIGECASNKEEQKRVARVAAKAGLSEYILSVASSMFEDRSRDALGREWLNVKQQAVHDQAIELCLILGRAGDGDGYAMADKLPQAVQLKSAVGMFALALDLAERDMEMYAEASVFFKKAGMKRWIVEGASEVECRDDLARRLFAAAADKGLANAALCWGMFEERCGNRSAAREAYKKAERLVRHREDVDMVTERLRRTSRNPLVRASARLSSVEVRETPVWMQSRHGSSR